MQLAPEGVAASAARGASIGNAQQSSVAQCHVEVAKLIWTEHLAAWPVDLILGADLVYSSGAAAAAAVPFHLSLRF
jgi:deoxyinosine 3'endonuclease (endonuclease V)